MEEKNKGFIYLTKPIQIILLNLNILKSGYSGSIDVFNRLNSYGDGSQLYTYFYVKNAKKHETTINILLRKYEKNKDIQKIYGSEYFSIPYTKIIYLMTTIMRDDIIYVMNIEEDIKNNKHKRVFPYFDHSHNNTIYNHIIKNVENYNNTYINQLKYFYDVYYKKNHKKMDILTNHINTILQNNVNNLLYNFDYNDEELDNIIQESNKNKNEYTNISLTNNSLYICHICLYSNCKKSDMKKHLDKQKKCTSEYSLNLSNEELYNRSLNNRFFFLFDYKNLTSEQLKDIILKFTNNMNYINYDNILNVNKNNKDQIEKDFLNKITKKDNNINNSVHKETKKIFKCTLCNKIYKSKQSLLKHLKNKSLCKNTQILNNMIKQSQVDL